MKTKRWVAVETDDGKVLVVEIDRKTKLFEMLLKAAKDANLDKCVKDTLAVPKK